MRSALIVAAKASDGELAQRILAADKRIKRKPFGGWNVIRTGGKRRGGRNR